MAWAPLSLPGIFPRVCGEKAKVAVTPIMAKGSPPRVRGKVALVAAVSAFLGITPACAGKRSRQRYHRAKPRDHPRVCGEKWICFQSSFWLWGSPPRVRGKGFGNRKSIDRTRITPACAGKRSLRLRLKFPIRDHPRVCGEKSTWTGGKSRVWGSPPRVRGKAERLVPIDHGTGITPACAGKRIVPKAALESTEDHPRVCGEKHRLGGKENNQIGSPPRVRGKGVVAKQHIKAAGITPACAGKRTRKISVLLSSKDHPRVCGEKMSARFS